MDTNGCQSNSSGPAFLPEKPRKMAPGLQCKFQIIESSEEYFSGVFAAASPHVQAFGYSGVGLKPHSGFQIWNPPCNHSL
jgi:hypothetical protein